MSNELDGLYRVTTTSSYDGPIKRRSDGETRVQNGQTERMDDANCKWTSTFTIESESEVKMVSLADPTNADIDFLLNAPDGTPTREITTYETILKYARKGDKIQLSGQIEYGHDVVFLTMRKISD
jgi:hypothetical protein